MYQAVCREKRAPAVKMKRKQTPIPVKNTGSYVVQRAPRLMKIPEDLREYIMEKDIEPIGRYCRERGYAISFRKAGAYTVQKLGLGAAAKGHHILEKSIKESSVDSREDFRYMPDALKGLVAHWDSSGGRSGIMKIDGLYMSRAGMERVGINENLNPAGQGEGAKQIVSLDTFIAILFQKMKEKAAAAGKKFSTKDADQLLEEEMERLSDIEFPAGMSDKDEQDQYKKQLAKLRMIAGNITAGKKGILRYSDFITGDYDMHDLAYIPRDPIKRGAVIMPSLAVKEGLNASLNGSIRPHSEFDRIQHGPQADYINYIQAHRREEMNPELMKMDPPVAMCGPDGKWYLLDSQEDVREYYEKWSLNSQLFWPSGCELNLRTISARIVRGETGR